MGKLQASFNSIYFGDREISHPACNYLHSYGYDFDNDKGWGLGDFDPNKTRSRAERNAKAWANFVGRVSSANNRLGAPTLKCLISNRLMTMHLNHGWSTEEISSYVRHTIKEIDKIRPTKSNPDPKAIVAGWYLGDDRLHPIKQTADSSLSAVIHAVHSAQKSCCVNWPFYFADNIDAAPFWNGANFSIPQKLKDWIDLFPDDATPVFMPYYYPWLSNNWDYTENPPWKKWKLYIEKLNKAFFNPDGTAKIHDNLKFSSDFRRISTHDQYGRNENGKKRGSQRTNWLAPSRSCGYAQTVSGGVESSTEISLSPRECGFWDGI